MRFWKPPLYQLELLPCTGLFRWCRRGDSNPHEQKCSQAPEACASANSATSARPGTGPHTIGRVSKPRKPSASPEDREILEIARNRRARHRYEILETLEVGIRLSGTEVKTLRSGQVSLDEAWVKVEGDQLLLQDTHIAEYTEGNRFNHDPVRPRPLLAHKREVRRLAAKVKERGLTLIPLRLLFRGKWVKLEIGLAKGKRLHDKRQSMRNKEDRRTLRSLKGRRT